MQLIVLIIHVIAAAGLIVLILLQHGKGADAGAAFGSGASQTMFGSVGSLPFLTKVTAIGAAVFFMSSLGLGYLTAKQAKQQQESVITAPLTASKQATKENATTVPIVESQSGDQTTVPALKTKKKSVKTPEKE